MVAGGRVRIGVLGGIGPEATAEFYRKLINKLQERELVKKNEDFPQIIINSIPAPELVGEHIVRKDVKPYIAGLKELDNLNVDFIVIVCNTIHLFHDELQKHVKAQILDLRKEVKMAAGNNAVVMGTPATVKSGMYGKGINRTDAERLAGAIVEFNMGRYKEKQKMVVKKIYEKYAKSATVVFGCTELALMLDKEKGINTIDVLVDATINFFQNYLNMKCKGDGYA